MISSELPSIPTFLTEKRPRLLIVGGKGGVGKTTTAAAIAVYWAQQQCPTLIVSTDPAHSLGDSLMQPIGDPAVPVADVPHLHALELDAPRRLAMFQERHGEVLRLLAEHGTFFDREDIDQLFHLTLPGIDEIMAMFEIASLVRQQTYALIVLDTAPTGHTLRLLDLPHVVEEWIDVLDQMLARERAIAARFGHSRLGEAAIFIEQLSADVAQVRSLLRDRATTHFLPVTIAERMALEETARLVANLHTLGIHIEHMIINRVAPPTTSAFGMARHTMHMAYSDEIGQRIPEVQLIPVPWFPHEIRGQSRLIAYAHAMIERGTPTPAPESPSPSSLLEHLPLLSPQALLSRLASPTHQLTLVGGKGGVGKTTIAVATALALLEHSPNRRILLFSTDPAHSLSDSLAIPIGDTITPVPSIAGLSALEMQPMQLLDEFKQQFADEIEAVFDLLLRQTWDIPYERQLLHDMIALTPPGLDELMALMKIVEWMHEGTFDHYILDMAPTGHALRFLELPGVVRQWFITIFQLFLKYPQAGRIMRLTDLLRTQSKRLRAVETLLRDPQRCAFLTVTIPETMAIRETTMLLEQLAHLRVACAGLVVNMMVPEDIADPWYEALRHEQHHVLYDLKGMDVEIIPVELCDGEVRGVDALRRLATMVYR